MNLKPCSPYFFVKIGKKAQADKKEKVGSLFFPQQYSFMRRELQFCEVLLIGDGAHEYFSEVEIGDYLLTHHFLTGKKTDNGYNFYKVDEDDDFNYYAVNGYEIDGERNLCYGVSKGTTLIPNRDYIFLEVEKENSGIEVSVNGLFTVTDKKKSREEWSAIMKSNLERCKQLGRNLPQNHIEERLMLSSPHKRELMVYSLSEIKKLEGENLRISKSLNKKKYELYTVLAVNDEWNEGVERSFGEKLVPGEEVYMISLACGTKIDVFGKEIIVAETQYFGGSLKYMSDAVARFNTGSKKKAGRIGNVKNEY
jgi:hypothetical protein